MNSFNDNELDRWLRQNAGSGHEAPAPDGWDTPPETVWEQLRAGLDERRKRRRLLWAVWSVVFIGLAGGAWYAGSSAFMPTRSQPFRAEKKDNEVSSGSTAFMPARSQLFRAEKTVSPSNDASNLTFSYEQKANPQNVSAGAKNEPRLSLPASSEGAQNNRLSVKNEIYRPAINGLDQGPRALGVLPDNSGTAAGAMAYVTPAPNPDIAPAPSLPTRSPEDNPVPLPVVPTPLPGKTAGAPALNLFPASPLVRPQKNRIKLYTGLSTGVFFTTRKLKPSGASVPNGQENGAWAWQQGLTFGWKFHRHWAIETGLQRAAIHLRADRALRFRYRLNQEQFDRQRFLYSNTANDVMETSFGAVEMRMDVGREPSRPVDDLAVFRVTLRTDEQARYWRVPLALRWSPASRGPWQWSLSGGIGFNFSAGYEINLAAARANRPGIRGIQARLLGRADGLAPVMTEVQFGGQVGYRLSRRCTLSLTPEFRHSLSPMYRGAAFRSLAVSAGAQAGLIWQL